MSAAEAAHRPSGAGRAVALSLAFLLIIGAAIGLAWIGAGALRPIVTQSGLQFRELKAGKGEPIGHADAALLDYILTSEEGTVVDQSQRPTPFSIDMPGLFPGFSEAMTRMREGGEYRFTMPQSLAFPRGAPQDFPKGPLTFEVKVEKIVRGGAAMLQQAQQMQLQEQQQQQQAPQPQQQ